MLTFELVTLEGVKFSSECWEVIIPTPDGQVAIFPEHMPLVSVSSPGVIAIRKRQTDKDEDMDLFATDGGVIEVVHGRKIRLLADIAEAAADINEMEAKEALKRAEELRANAGSQVDLAQAVGLIEQQTARLRVAELRRRKRRNI